MFSWGASYIQLVHVHRVHGVEMCWWGYTWHTDNKCANGGGGGETSGIISLHPHPHFKWNSSIGILHICVMHTFTTAKQFYQCLQQLTSLLIIISSYPGDQDSNHYLYLVIYLLGTRGIICYWGFVIAHLVITASLFILKQFLVTCRTIRGKILQHNTRQR